MLSMDEVKKTSYDLSHTTMVLEATENDGSWESIILEERSAKPFYVKTAPVKLIEKTCRQNGEELLTRHDGAKILCGFSNKSPIAISVTKNLYYFPTHSPSNPQCSWLSHTHVRDIKAAKYGGSTVIFRDGQTIDLQVSKSTMLKQLYRTAQFRFILEQQLKPIKKKDLLEALLKALGYDLF